MHSVTSNGVYNALQGRVQTETFIVEGQLSDVHNVTFLRNWLQTNKEYCTRGKIINICVGETNNGFDTFIIGSTDPDYFTVFVVSFYIPLQKWVYNNGVWGITYIEPTDSLGSDIVNPIASYAVFNNFPFRRTFDNTSLGWNETDIKNAIKNIINFYINNPDDYVRELKAKTLICHDYHNGGGSGCLILTDNGLPYCQGLYFTYYTNDIYFIKYNGVDIAMYKYAGTYVP